MPARRSNSVDNRSNKGYIKNHKNDQKGIGRWARTDYEGKGGRKTVVYLAYIPNAATGEMTVYRQHSRALLKLWAWGS